MHCRRILALSAAIVVALALAGASLAGTGRAGTIRIEGLTKTLQLPTVAVGENGWITKGGTPRGKCSGQSVAGALDRVTRHQWTGKYYPSVGGIFVTSIMGEKPAGNDYWVLFVDNKVASLGVCALRLRGEQVLFADSDGSHYPASLTAPQSAVAGRSFVVKLAGYTAKGKPKALAGVPISGNGIKAVSTNSHGVATISDKHAGVLVLRAGPNGYLRTEAIVHVARR